jgi:CRP-like cAMP-binding protein
MIFLWIGYDERIPDGTVVYQEGDDKDSTGAVLIAGTVSVSRDGQESAIDVAAPELFGEMHQLTDTAQRTATVTAKGDVEILRFEWHEFIALVASMFTPDEQILIRGAIEGLSQSRKPAEPDSPDA